MAFTANAIIANIEDRLGDSGAHVWSYYGLARGTFWCAAEVCFTFAKTGNKNKIFGGKLVTYVPTAQVWLENHYKTIYDYRTGGDLKKVRKGDVVIFMWSRGSRDHIGFARASGEAGKLDTIEGNTSGGIVAKRTREKKYIYAVYRPPYSGGADPKPAPKPIVPTYSVSKTYTTAVDCLNVRTGAGTKYSAKKKSQLTKDGQKHANAKGQLRKGTRVTAQKVKKVGKEIWIKIPSGWICAWTGSKKYVR